MTSPAEQKAREIVVAIIEYDNQIREMDEWVLAPFGDNAEKLIAHALEDAYQRGKQLGMQEEAIRCQEHFQKAAESMRERAAKYLENIADRRIMQRQRERLYCFADAIRSLPLVEGEKPWTCNGCGKENPLIQHVLECDKPSALRSNDGESRTSGEQNLGGKRA